MIKLIILGQEIKWLIFKVNNSMSFNQDGIISIRNSKPLKLIDQFIYLSSNISSTKSDINICIVKSWTAIDYLVWFIFMAYQPLLVI